MRTDNTASELREALRELRPHALRAAWFSLVSGLLVLAPSWYMLEVYERVVNSRSTMTLAMLTVAVLAAYVLMEVLEWVRAEIMFAASCRLDARLAPRVFAAAFDANRRRLPGGGRQAMQDLRTVRDFLHSQPLLAAMELPAALVFLVLVFAIHPLLGVVALNLACLQALVGMLNQRSTREPLEEANRAGFAAQHQAERMQGHAPVIASMGMVGAMRRRWARTHDEAVSQQAEASRRGGTWQAVAKLLQNLVNSSLLGLSCWLLLHDKLNGGGGMLVVAGIFGARVLAPFVQIISQWASVANARQAATRLDALLRASPAPADAMPLPAPKGALAVEQVVAVAPGGHLPVLKGIAFGLKPGEAVVVMGPSGAGKSCLARLLLGLWPAASGKVRLDGVDVHGWDKAELGPHLGYLPQNVALVEGTIADNIARFGRADAATVQAAAEAVGLHEFIAALPGGYDTWLGPNGCTLSGGQRQRVALARAIYGEPAFVVLDEPNASLDEAGDAALARVIAHGKRRGCSFVVMSHRASVLAVADHLLLLRDGQQQAFGPRDEVLAAIQRANAEAAARAGEAAAPLAPAARMPAAANA